MNQSGQFLIISVLLLVVLLIAIPAIILVNRTATHHNTMSLVKTKGRAIAEEGLAFAIQQLSQPGPPPSWPLSPGFLQLPTGFDGSQTFTSTQGGAYKITCTPG